MGWDVIGIFVATVRKREGKKGASWQIDYFDPKEKGTH